MTVSWRSLFQLIGGIFCIVAVVWYLDEPGPEPLIAIINAIGAFIASSRASRELIQRKSIFSMKSILLIMCAISWLVSFWWSLDERNWEPIVTAVAGTLALFAAIKARITPIDWSGARDSRNFLLKQVQFVIDDLLERLMRDAVTVLPLEIIKYRLNAQGHFGEKSKESQPFTLASSKSIFRVFEQADERLLILGEPGYGKTTVLLKLARELLDRAQLDKNQPIPVVLNLSSWVRKRKPFNEWMVDEINSHYYIKKRLARAWVAGHKLLLLLDGLDEIDQKYREECIFFLNEFLNAHWHGIVVCSRTTEYEALNTGLKLNDAIVLQALSHQQVEKYLVSGGNKLSSARIAVQADAALRELAKSPLNLGIIARVYNRMPLDDLRPGTLPERRRQLFNAYIQIMSSRYKTIKAFTPIQTVRWLKYLAQKMDDNYSAVFLIEQLQPSWLSSRTQRLTYGLTTKVISGVILTLNLSLGAAHPEFNVIAGLIAGLLSGLIDEVRFTWSIKFTKNNTSFSPGYWWSTFNILSIVGVVGFLMTLIVNVRFGLPTSLAYGWTIGVILGIFLGLRTHRRSIIDDIQTVDTLNWSWRRAKRGVVVGAVMLMALFLALILITLFFSASVAGVPFDSNIGQYIDKENLQDALKLISLGFVLTGLIGGILGAFFGGLVGGILTTKAKPNQGIRLSIKNALWTGFLVTIVMGLLSILVTGNLVVIQPLNILTTILLRGSSFGLFVGFWFGGFDVIQHFVLRFILWRKNYVPWNYARFLAQCDEQIFLRKAGSGYSFVHRLLQKHFAEMETITDTQLIKTPNS